MEDGYFGLLRIANTGCEGNNDSIRGAEHLRAECQQAGRAGQKRIDVARCVAQPRANQSRSQHHQRQVVEAVSGNTGVMRNFFGARETDPHRQEEDQPRSL